MTRTTCPSARFDFRGGETRRTRTVSPATASWRSAAGTKIGPSPRPRVITMPFPRRSTFWTPIRNGVCSGSTQPRPGTHTSCPARSMASSRRTISRASRRSRSFGSAFGPAGASTRTSSDVDQPAWRSTKSTSSRWSGRSRSRPPREGSPPDGLRRSCRVRRAPASFRPEWRERESLGRRFSPRPFFLRPVPRLARRTLPSWCTLDDSLIHGLRPRDYSPRAPEGSIEGRSRGFSPSEPPPFRGALRASDLSQRVTGRSLGNEAAPAGDRFGRRRGASRSSSRSRSGRPLIRRSSG